VSDPRRPGLGTVLNRAMDRRLENVRGPMPAKVVSYDATRQSVDVHPQVKFSYEGEDGERVTESQPVITDVPVLFPGGGGLKMQWPLTAGDTVLLVFCEQSIDKWLDQGREVDPGDDRRFHMSDAVAVPELRSFARNRGAIPAGIIYIGEDGDTGQPAVLGDDLETRLSTLEAQFNSHRHSAPSSGGPTSQPHVMSAAFIEQHPPSNDGMANPPHVPGGPQAEFHVHGPGVEDTDPDCPGEPSTISTVEEAVGSDILSTKVRIG
jgi:hypothetical protein